MKGLTMIKNSRRKIRKRVIASVLTGMFALQAGAVGTFAATNITPNSTTTFGGSTFVNQNGNTFNITVGAGNVNAGTGNGYAHFSNFSLGNYDTANLHFDNIPGAFYNMVDGHITINGVLNSMKNNAFHNGKVVFVSPSGLTVGKDGVINVGSLGVHTPTTQSYQNMVEYGLEPSKNFTRNGTITIDGKILAVDEIDMRAGKINVTSNGALVAGINSSKMVTTKTLAENLFDNIVNGSYKSATNFVNSNGTITLKSFPTYYDTTTTTNTPGLTVGGEIRNIATNGEIKLYNNNTKTSGMDISGIVWNDNGKISIENYHGDLNISGDIKNKGTTIIANTPTKTSIQYWTGLTDINGMPIGEGEYQLTIADNHNTKLDISGNIQNEGNLTIINTGHAGTNIANTALIKNTGNTEIYNGYTGDPKSDFGLDASKYNFDNTLNIDNTKIGDLNIDGTINNTGDLTINNYAEAGGLNVGTGATITSSGSHVKRNDLVTGEEIDFVNPSNLTIYNKGANGMNLNGNITHTGNSVVTNDAGALNIGGTFINNGGKVRNLQTLDGTEEKHYDATFVNNGTDFNITGTVENRTIEYDRMLLGSEVDGTKSELYMTNNGSGQFHVDGGSITADGITMINNGAGLRINGNITNSANGLYQNNKGDFIVDTKGNIKNTNNTATFEQNGDGVMTFAGVVDNNGTTIVRNAENSGLMTIGGTFTNKGATEITNNGAGLLVNGTLTNTTNDRHLITDKLTMTNNAGTFKIDKTGVINNNGQGVYTNNGVGGFIIDGKLQNNGKADILNTKGAISVSGTIDNTGTTTITNEGSSILVNTNGTILNRDGKLTITNKDGGIQVYQNGTIKNENNDVLITNNGVSGIYIEEGGNIESGALLNIDNTGTQGIENHGIINANGKITMNNTGRNGIYIGSTGRINSNDDIDITNTPAAGTGTAGDLYVGGLINGKNVNIKTTGSNLRIGDSTANDNYITAANDINITADNASILNAGYAKVLLNAAGNLNMNVTNGTIGLPVQQAACTGSGCTGIGPMADGSRDFTKSVNANIGGKVNARTINTTGNAQDLVINYAAINSDMNIDAIKADGRVILTVDDDYGVDNNGTRYNMINASTDPTKANVEGWGMSLISNGSIGEKENKLTFNQTNAPQYAMDALANENIYMKGLDDKYTANEVCTMIAREGDLDVEFSGNTHIKNITAEGDMTVITRGKSLKIDNLGHIEDSSVTPNDYFGPRHDGYEFDGRYDKADYKSDVLPNNVTLKALDINKNIRPDGEMIDGYYAYADSTVRVTNGVVDNGTMNITADNIYANGVYAGFNRLGYNKIKEPSTNVIAGIYDPDALNSPVGNAVRPDDVTGIGRDEHERNYYYPAGDGDTTVGGKDSNVDDNDGIADNTPLIIGDKGEDTPDNPNIKPNEQNQIQGDKSFAWKKVDDNEVEAIDKRQYMRFNVDTNPCPVAMERTNNGIDELIDVSRGGIAVTHSNKLKVGDVVPVHLTYADLDIKANVKVVSASTTRAGAEFVNLDKATANKLLYLSLLLEDPALSYNK